MQITVEELLNAQHALQTLATNTSIAPAIKLRLLPITRSFDQHVKDVNEIRIELFKKHGRPVKDDPSNFELDPENKDAAAAMTADWKSLLNESRSIPGKRLKFENVSQAPLSTADYLTLEWLIEFPAEVEDEAPEAAKAAVA